MILLLLIGGLIVVLPLQSLAPVLVSLELIQLYEQVVYILQVLNLVDLLELVN